MTILPLRRLLGRRDNRWVGERARAAKLSAADTGARDETK